MDGVPGDLQGKYQKIAAEYAKVGWHVCHVICSLKVSTVLKVIVHNVFVSHRSGHKPVC